MSENAAGGGERVTFEVSEWEGHLVLGALGLQAEDPEDLSPEDISALHELRDKLVGQFREQLDIYTTDT